MVFRDYQATRYASKVGAHGEARIYIPRSCLDLPSSQNHGLYPKTEGTRAIILRTSEVHVDVLTRLCCIFPLAVVHITRDSLIPTIQVTPTYPDWVHPDIDSAVVSSMNQQLRRSRMASFTWLGRQRDCWRMRASAVPTSLLLDGRPASTSKIPELMVFSPNKNCILAYRPLRGYFGASCGLWVACRYALVENDSCCSCALM